MNGKNPLLLKSDLFFKIIKIMNKENLLKEIIKKLDEDSSELSGSDYLDLQELVRDHCNDNIQAYNDTHSEEKI